MRSFSPQVSRYEEASQAILDPSYNPLLRITLLSPPPYLWRCQAHLYHRHVAQSAEQDSSSLVVPKKKRRVEMVGGYVAALSVQIDPFSPCCKINFLCLSLFLYSPRSSLISLPAHHLVAALNTLVARCRPCSATSTRYLSAVPRHRPNTAPSSRPA